MCYNDQISHGFHIHSLTKLCQSEETVKGNVIWMNAQIIARISIVTDHKIQCFNLTCPEPYARAKILLPPPRRDHIHVTTCLNIWLVSKWMKLIISVVWSLILYINNSMHLLWEIPQYCYNTCQIGFKGCLSSFQMCILSEKGR